MAWKKDPKQYKKGQIILASLLFISLVIIAVLLWVFVVQKDGATVETTPIAQQQAITPANEVSSEEEQPKFNALALQQAVDAWSQSIPGEASVVITTIDGVTLATLNPDEPYFAASIYKLYVAYEGYRQIDDNQVDPSEVYLNGFTRAECLDKMIRESDSPCAEKLWVELGKQEVTQTLMSYGITNTSMVNITTTAGDTAIMLQRIASGEALNSSSQAKFLESMKTQIYRDTLNKSFADDVIVYNKIGFRELDEYHDTAIVEFPDGRKLVVAVLTSNVGTRNIIDLGTAIQEAATQ